MVFKKLIGRYMISTTYERKSKRLSKMFDQEAKYTQSHTVNDQKRR